jgi:hypothetical protein
MPDERIPQYLAPDGPIPAEEAAAYPILMYGPDLPYGDQVVACYRDEESFAAAADRMAAGPRVRRVLQQLRDIRMLDGDEAERVRRLQTNAVEHVRSGLDGFVRAHGADHLTDELEQRAMSGTPLEPPVFDPVLLYDKPFLTSPPIEAPPYSATLPLPSGYWPDFRWFGWNDRARGARIFGGTVLYEHIWFGGRQVWLFGLNGLIPLRALLFDLTASSAVVF